MPRVRVASRTAWSSFAFAALDFANQFEPVLMCTPAMRAASVIDEPAAMAAKKRALSSGGTRRFVPTEGVYYFLFLFFLVFGGFNVLFKALTTGAAANPFTTPIEPVIELTAARAP